MNRPDADLVRDEFRLTARLLAHSCRRVQLALETDLRQIATLQKTLLLDMEEILPEYRRIWLARNRPGGLADSVRGFEALLAEYQAGA
jgi:hexosaminidase